MVSAALALVAGGLDGAGAAAEHAAVTTGSQGDPVELTELRTRTSDTYLLPDGTYRAVLSQHAVNFKDASGGWKSIDNAIVPSGGGGFHNAANAYDAHLPENAAAPVRFTQDGVWIQFHLVGARGAAAVSGNRATYADALPGVDVAYAATGDLLQESLTVDHRTDVPADGFVFDVQTSPGLTAKASDSGAVDFVDASGKTVLGFLPPSMTDSSKTPSGSSRAISVKLAQTPSGYRMTLVPDAAWLASPQREWPVTIDPTTGTVYLDCTVTSAYSTSQYCPTTYLVAGQDPYGTWRTLDPWTLSNFPPNVQVLNADLALYAFARSNTTSFSVSAYQQTRAHNQYATWNTYDGTNPWTTAGGDFVSTPDDTTSGVGSAVNAWVHFYPTKLVQGWLDGTIPNDGLVLKATTEPAPSWVEFYSAEAANGLTPTLSINYTPRTGEPRQFTFDRKALGDRISADVNVANGNLVLDEHDLLLPGTNLDLNVDRFHNSLAGNAFSDTGNGFAYIYGTSNQVTFTADGSAFLFGPSDEPLLFQKNGSSFVAPTAIDASFVKNGDGSYTMTIHKTGVRWNYNGAGYLTSEVTPNGNAIGFVEGACGSRTCVTSITDTHGRTFAISYDSTGHATRATDSSGRAWSFSYNANGQLVSYTDPGGNTTTFAYDASSNLSSVTDARGGTTSFAYDGWRRVTSITRTGGLVTTYAYASADSSCPSGSIGKTTSTDPLGHATSWCFDSNMRVTRATDARGAATTTAYNADSNPVGVVDALGRTTSFGYDGAGENMLWSQSPLENPNARPTFAYGDSAHPYLVTRFTDARGKATTYAYDANGNLTSSTLDGTTTARYAYDGFGQVTSATDGNGNATTYAYDGSHNLLTSTDPLGNRTSYTYDGLGRIATRVDPLGHATSWTYDALDRAASSTNELGNRTSWSFDANGNPTTLTDAGGNVATQSFDGLNRLVKSTSPDPDGAGPLAAPATTYGYDGAGNLTSLVDPRGSTTTYAYDAADHVASETMPSGGKTTYFYDAAGNLTSTVEARGNVPGANPAAYTTTYGYDAGGQLTSTTDPLGNRTSYAYDLGGNQTGTTDAANHTTAFSYDAAGRVLSTTAPDGGVTTYSYDGNGNQLTRIDANGHASSYAYDAGGRLVTTTGPDPDGAGPLAAPVTTYGYDANGNLTSFVDPNGNATATAGDGTTSYAYDAAGQLKQIGYSDSTHGIAFDYDAVGNRTSMTDAGGTASYTYDALGRTTRVARGADTFTYAYDGAGNVTSRTYPDGTAVSSTFDGDNRLTGVSTGGGTTSYTYDAAGNLTRTALPNGYTETRTYDAAGQVTDLSNTSSAGVLSEFAYTLDAVGNPTTITQSGAVGGTTTFGYDASDRVTSVCYQASCPNAADPYIRWAYDKVGNRVSETKPSGTTSYSYNAADELTAAGATSYSYDADGNETAAGGRTFAYDLANHVVSTSSGGGTTAFAYDGDGNRIQSGSARFLWDGNADLPQLALERNAAGGLARRYVYGASRISMSTPTASYYYGYDSLGSVRNLTSSSGASEWTYGYDPFGATRTQTQNDANAPDNVMKFTAASRDETGYYHLGAREYNPDDARFTRPDPAPTEVTDASASGYGYVGEQPTVYADPSGLVRCKPSAYRCWYRNPFARSSRLATQRTDMGVDYDGVGPIAAIGDGTMMGWDCCSAAGWPPTGRGVFMRYRLKNGPLVGHLVYVAEGIKPTVGQSTPLRRGQTIANFTYDASPSNRYATGIETGWASPTLNLTYFNFHCGHYDNSWNWTAPGRAFARLLRRLGAPTRENPGAGAMFTNSCAHGPQG